MEQTTEIQEVSLDQVIETKLVQSNVTDKVINALKKQYGGMALKSLDDKQGYLEIKEARANVRKIGILAEKCCKAGREDAVRIQKMWLAKEKEVLGKIAEVQDPLDVEMKKFEDEQERLEQIEIQRKEEQFMKRQTTLLKMEAVYGDGCIILGNVSYDINNIKEADEEIWTDTILPKFQREFEKVEFERAEQERVAREAKEKFEKEQAEFKQQQEEFNRQREEMRLMQEELQKEKDRVENIEREKVRQQEMAEQKRVNDLQSQRLSLLLPVNPNGADVDMATLWALSDEDFSKILESKKVEFAKKEEERVTLLKEQAAAAERLRIEQEQKDAEIKRQRLEQQKAEEADKASDKDKWQVLLNTLSSVVLPDFKSNIYKGKLSILKEKLEEINEL